MSRILVVDDEKTIVKGIKFSLEQDFIDVDCAYDGDEAVQKAKETAYDLILLDVMLPKKDGFEVCKIIRQFSDVPIIMLTAKCDDMDKIAGLDGGADDYITKPFNILEVKARIKAVTRRNTVRDKKEPIADVIGSNDFEMNMEERKLYVKGKEVNLTVKEYELLKLLMKNPGKVYSREKLLGEIWGFDYPGDARTVDVHVRRIREKVENDPSHPVYIHTKWGFGYYYSGK